MNRFQLLAIVGFGIGAFALAAPKLALEVRDRLFSDWGSSFSILEHYKARGYGAIAMRVYGLITIFVSVIIFVLGSP